MGLAQCLEDVCADPTKAELRRCCLGSLLNVTMDNEPIELEIVERNGIQNLLLIIESGAYKVFVDNSPDQYDEAYLALQLLSNIVECGILLKIH